MPRGIYPRKPLHTKKTTIKEDKPRDSPVLLVTITLTLMPEHLYRVMGEFDFATEIQSITLDVQGLGVLKLK